MPIIIRELAAPPAIRDKEAKDAENVERFMKERNKLLSKKQLEKLEKHLRKVVKAAKKESDPLRSRLIRYSDMLEGIVEETNFPFEGASNITLRYGTGLARTFESAFNKTVYSDEDLFYPVFDPGAEQELKINEQQLVMLQEGFNHSFSQKTNGLRILKGGTIPAFRDGTFLIEGSWERRTERVNDQKTYRNIDEFQKDYPDNEAAGISLESYQGILDQFLVEPETELICRFSYDFVKFDGIEYRQVLRAKFLVYPTSSKNIDESSLFGCFFEIDKAVLERRGKRGEFYNDQVKKALTKKAAASLDHWDRNRLFVQGLSAPEPESAPFRMIDLVIKFDMDDDDVLEQYHVKAVVEGEGVIVVACRPYDLRHNIPNVIPMRLVGRDHAFDGISLIGDGEDLFNQVDTLFRHDNNVMMLTTSPMFLADQTLKDTIDLGRAENVMRPGITYWVADPDKNPIRQLVVQDVAASSGDNNNKMAILSRFAELLIGVSQGESGAQTPDDPRAPARKTQLLLMQANRRIDNCIDEWCLSFPDLAKLHATLLYQFSGSAQYRFSGADKQPKTFDISLLVHPGLKWSPRRRSVTLTPEFALARLQSLFATYSQMRPLLMQGDQVAIEMWNRNVKNSGEPQCEKFMIDAQKAPELAQKAIEQAMKHFQMQSAMKATAKGEETLAKESAKHVVNMLSEMAQAKMSGADQMLASGQPQQPQQQPQPQPTGV